MNRIALACILALYIGVAWVESQPLTMWGPRTTPVVRQPGAENLRPDTRDKPGLTKPVIGGKVESILDSGALREKSGMSMIAGLSTAGTTVQDLGAGGGVEAHRVYPDGGASPATSTQDRAWVEGCKGRCVKLASQRTPDEFPFYLRPVAAGEPALGMDAQWGVPVGIRTESTQTLLPPAATRENTTMPRELSGSTAEGCGHCALAPIIDVGAGDGWTDSGGPMASRPAPLISDRSGYDAMGNITDRADSVVGTPGGTPGGRDGQSRPGVRGKATYYHPSLAGLPMANGEPYDPKAMTAASNSYPLGTVLRVSRSITVVVTDRGAFTHALDLSEAAFQALAPLSVGVIEVSMREVE